MMLNALLDTLLPGDGNFPAASATSTTERLGIHDRFAATIAGVASALPPDFSALSTAQRTAALAEVETAQPADFHAFLTGVYSLYYTDPAVAEAIARLTGYQTRPPQPEGYALEPFDPAMVAIPAARARLYRPTPGGHHD